MDQCLDKRFLNSVQGIRLVAQQPKGHAEGDLSIATEELLERFAITPPGPLQQHLVAGQQ